MLSTFRSLEIHSKRQKKNLYLFGHPIHGGTSVFAKLLGLQYYFPENVRCNLTYYESENFTITFLNSKILRSLFFYEKFPNLRSAM